MLEQSKCVTPLIERSARVNTSQQSRSLVKMMFIPLFTIFLVTEQAVNGLDSFKIERSITQSEDDVETYASGCQTQGNELDISYYTPRRTLQDILLIFRNIPNDKDFYAKEAHVEFQAQSTTDEPLSAVIRYNTVSLYDEAKCKFALKENWSNATLMWHLPATVNSQIFKTLNISQLVTENFQSQLWKATGRLELIISPDPTPNTNDPKAFRQGRSYDSWKRSKAGNSAPKLVIQYEAFNPQLRYKQCSTNEYLRGYGIVNHTSSVAIVASSIHCCKLCSQLGQSCMSFTLEKLSRNGDTPQFNCQMNNITKEESDRSHCFVKDPKYVHYHVIA